VEDDDLRDLFAAFGPIGIRRMFGGKGLYADGVIAIRSVRAKPAAKRRRPAS
jgi:TfoX/Sxy family transcriptional regulator of competence genes